MGSLRYEARDFCLRKMPSTDVQAEASSDTHRLCLPGQCVRWRIFSARDPRPLHRRAEAASSRPGLWESFPPSLPPGKSSQVNSSSGALGFCCPCTRKDFVLAASRLVGRTLPDGFVHVHAERWASRHTENQPRRRPFRKAPQPVPLGPGAWAAMCVLASRAYSGRRGRSRGSARALTLPSDGAEIWGWTRAS